jgi:hypothetical protein
MRIINKKIGFMLSCLCNGLLFASAAEMSYEEAVTADRKQDLLKYAYAAHDMVDSVAAVGNKAGVQLLLGRYKSPEERRNMISRALRSALLFEKEEFAKSLLFQNSEVDEEFLHKIFRDAIKEGSLCIFDFFIRHGIDVHRPFNDSFRIVREVSPIEREGKSCIETKFSDVAVDSLLVMIDLAQKFGGEVDLRKGEFVAISTNPIKIRSLELMRDELIKRGVVQGSERGKSD